MTCLLLPSHMQITCFRSAASSRDKPNLLNAFPSLLCTVLSDCETQEVLLQFMDGLT